MPRVFTKVTSTAFLAGLLVGVLGTSTVGAALKGSTVFSDVPAGSYYDDAVGEMYEKGVIKGNPDGSFRPEAAVSRAEIAVMMKRLRDEILGIAPAAEPAPSPSPSPEPEPASSAESSSHTSRSARSRASSTSAAASSADASVGAAGGLRFSVEGFNISESAKSASISVSRVGGSKGSVTVAYETQDGTTKGGEDYTILTGTLRFAEEETTKVITIALKEDVVAEGTESFKVVLKNPTGGAVLQSPSTATISIIDNEKSSGGSGSAGSAASAGTAGSLQWSAPTYSMAENIGSITVTVERKNGTKGAVAVNYATSNGTATSADYAATNGTLSFADGETSKTFAISLTDDSSIDGSKTVNLTLSNVTGGAVIAAPTAVLTIVDNESANFGTGSLKFSTSTYTVTESVGNASITIQRIGGAAGTVTVQFDTSNGTATAASDYTPVSVTLTFATGEASKVVLVPILKDNKFDEGEETINLNIGNVTGGAELGTPINATIKIST